MLVACGGKVGIDDSDAAPDTGTESDGGGYDVTPSEDTSTPIPTDTGPWGCGSGPCDPGMGCSDGCNECTCIAKDSWSCTDRPCVDSGPVEPPCPAVIPGDRTSCGVIGQYCTYMNKCGGYDVAQCVATASGAGAWATKRETCTAPSCPPSQPTPMTPCSADLKCAYPNGCGGTNTAWCDGKYWNLSTGPCTAPACPTVQPVAGSGCTGPNKCSYSNGCGGFNTAVCDGPMSKWAVYKGDCTPPPPPPVCPTAMPPAGSMCVPGMSCNWNNGCGGLTYGYCSSGTWSMKSEGCAPGCPASKPTSGLACKVPSSSSCRYIVPGTSSCTSQCFCADDYRWACVTPPCMGSGGTPGGEVPPF